MSFSGGLRSQLGSLKHHLANRTRDARNSFNAEPASADLDDIEEYVEELEEGRDKVESTLQKFTAVHDRWLSLMEGLSDPALQDAEQQRYDAVSDEYSTLIADCEDLILRCTRKVQKIRRPAAQPPPPAAATPHAPPQPQSQGAMASTAGTRSLPIKPPRLNLPVFDGDCLKYKQWMGLFHHNIHERTDMTNIEKFTYLVEKLGPKARTAIEGLNIEDGTYDIAIDLLNERFDRATDRVVTMLYSEFQQIPDAIDTISSKQATLDRCERVLRQLESSGEQVNANRSLTVALLGKFPPDMIIQLQFHKQVGANSSLAEVRKGLKTFLAECETNETVIKDLQRMKVNKDGSSMAKNQRSRTEDAMIRNPENSALPAVSSETVGARRVEGFRRPQMLTPPTECYFCQGDHFNSSCPKYKSAKARERRLLELKRCKRCMRSHDRGWRCPIPIRCVKCGTNESHATALCYRTYPETANQNDSVAAQSEGSSRTQVSKLKDTDSGGITALNNHGARPALFQTAKTVMVNTVTGEQLPVRIAMDTMSSRTYVTEAVAQKLNLASEADGSLYVSVFGTSRTLELPSRQVEFALQMRDGSRVEVTANTTKVICRSSAFPKGWTRDEAGVIESLRDSLADDPFDTNGMIDVLLGSNWVWEFIRGGRMSTNAPKLYVIPSRFGLLLAGESTFVSEEREAPAMLCLTESPCQYPSELGLVAATIKFETDYPDIDEFWNMERIGIADSPTENEDDKAVAAFRESVSFRNGRYEVKWPVIPEKFASLPTNYDTAYNRFRGLTKRLKAKPEILEGYRNNISQQLDMGIIERVPDDEISTTRPVHYLPHQPVVKQSSATTKIRIVYDAGSKTDKKSVSLNDCLLRGPVILPDLCQMLMRMRVYEIAVVADIEKAFLQISLHPEHRDTTRFLWFKDDRNLSLADNVTAYRFCRIFFGGKSCPSILGVTIQHHLAKEGTQLAEELKDDTFVDNIFHGLNDEDSSIECYHAMKDLFARAGMNLQEFCSNSPRLMTCLPSKDRVKNADTKFLGLKWDSQTDDTLRLIPSEKCLAATEGATKRSILQAVASLFDPLGFFQPVLLPAKLLLQKLWDFKFDWDDPVTPDLRSEWHQIRESLVQLWEHRIPRFVGRSDREFTLAVLTDASGSAYSAVVYLRCKVSEGVWRSNFLFAKSRLAPRAKKRTNECQSISIPRLELLGMLIGVRAANFCRNGLKVPDAHIDLFCDAECVHAWLRSRSYLERFVRSRIDEIKQAKNIAFHFVGTNDNPADYSTRGMIAEELLNSSAWWYGPTFLEVDQEKWPIRNISPVDDGQLNQEDEVKPVYMSHTLVATGNAPEEEAQKFLHIDPKRYNSLSKLLRVSVRCLKFLKHLVWNRLTEASKDENPGLRTLFDQIADDPNVTAAEFQVSKDRWAKFVQNDRFAEVMEALGGGQPQHRVPLISQLGLKLDGSGLIRACGRMENAALPQAARLPILLPAQDHFTKLVIWDAHNTAMHAGISHTLSVTRHEFWIIHGRATVRKLLRNCLICREFKSGKPFKLPPMPQLPDIRLQPAAPFQFTGLDYFGPVTILVRDERAKMWASLFTCLVTRAIHLEPVVCCSAPEFLNAFIRFTCRRGAPQWIISDNAAQFKLVEILGNRAWERVPTNDTIRSYLADKKISWKYITELAPWQGGLYERLVGVVKSALRTSIRRKTLTWSDFVTLLVETEAVVNSRPITYVSDDPESQSHVLRPSDFLLATPWTINPGPDVRINERNFGDAGKRLLAAWKKRKATLQNLWHNWQEDYLQALRERPVLDHAAGRGDVTRPPKIGEVVLIRDEDLPRGRWKTGRISEVIRSNDGQVRSAEVILPSRMRIRRPINLLIPLEVDSGLERWQHEDGQPTASPTQGQAEPPDDDDEPWDFPGFTTDDVERTARALQRFDSDDSQPRASPDQPGTGADDQ